MKMLDKNARDNACTAIIIVSHTQFKQEVKSAHTLHSRAARTIGIDLVEMKSTQMELANKYIICSNITNPQNSQNALDVAAKRATLERIFFSVTLIIIP